MEVVCKFCTYLLIWLEEFYISFIKVTLARSDLAQFTVSLIYVNITLTDYELSNLLESCSVNYINCN
jgi:hypothetical protein